jgi:predicted deacylase
VSQQGKETRWLTAESREGEEVRVPVATARGAKDGPTLLVIAGVHGSEYVGIEATKRLFQWIDPARMNGTLITIPCFGLPAFWGLAAHINPIDGVDTGRAFPGDPAGSHSARAANLVWTHLLPQADALIDVHGGDLEEELVEYTQINLCGNAAVDDAGEALARALGFPLFVRQPQPVERPANGSAFSMACYEGKPGVLAEAGSHGDLDFAVVEVYLRALKNAVHHVGIVPGEPELDSEPRLLHRFAGIKAPVEGFWYPSVKKGEEIHKEQVVGEMHDIFGEKVADVTSHDDGVILGVITTPARRQDAMLIGLGTLD